MSWQIEYEDGIPVRMRWFRPPILSLPRPSPRRTNPNPDVKGGNDGSRRD